MNESNFDLPRVFVYMMGGGGKRNPNRLFLLINNYNNLKTYYSAGNLINKQIFY